ncbi:hypothetical protein KEM56_006478 [Ascosphaera pollenicola]|nr:hypothetical protein KEM56_006478 [Ascosphaera pollenicola]
MAEAQEYVLTQLFGGAMSVELPEGMSDVSDLRQVPDHQEVFAHSVSPFSVIIELAERVKPEDAGSAENAEDADRKCALFHLEEICRLGGDTYEMLEDVHPVKISKIDAPAYTAEARFMSGPKPSQTAGTAPGIRQALSGKSDATRFLLIRLKEQTTDIVVTITLDESSPEEAGKMRRKFATFFEHMKETLQIHDWKLFG